VTDILEQSIPIACEEEKKSN